MSTRIKIDIIESVDAFLQIMSVAWLMEIVRILFTTTMWGCSKPWAVDDDAIEYLSSDWNQQAIAEVMLCELKLRRIGNINDSVRHKPK